MSFAWPHLLWLLVLPVALFVRDWRRRQVLARQTHPKIRRAHVAAGAVSVAPPPKSARRVRTRPWLLLGLSFGIVALARPQWGRIDEPVFDQSREILIAIDLSRSMLATDIKPSRLDRAKLLVQALLDKLKGERVGLVVFSGTAFLQSPLSADYEILRDFLPSLRPDYLPEGGTNYRALIDTSLDAFGAGNAADRFLIVLSDGEATDDDWRDRVDDLTKKGVHVIALGVGTEAGSMIPDGSGGLVKDERGAVVLSKLESGTLRELAQQTHGVYRDASGWIDLAGLIDQTVAAARKGQFVDKRAIRLVERFQWPLAFALWCLLVSLYYEFPVQPRARDLPKPPPLPKSPLGPGVIGRTAALALLLVGALALGPRAHAISLAPPAKETPEPPPANAPAGSVPNAAPAPSPLPLPTPSSPNSPIAPIAPNSPSTAAKTPSEAQTLAKMVTRLSGQDRLSTSDLSEFAQQTLSWGRRLHEAGQPVPAGPVRDALAAVDQLEQRTDAAHWKQLRDELQALLKKPPQPPKQQQKQKKQDNQNKQDKSQDQKSGQQGKSDQKKQDQNGEPPPNDQSQSDQNQQQHQNQSSPKPDQQNGQSGKPNDQGSSEPPKPPPSNQSLFGDTPKKAPPPPPPSSGTQKIGGAAQPKPGEQPTDPQMALPLQKLDQLKSQDSPAKLFELMQADRSSGTNKKPKKDW